MIESQWQMALASSFYSYQTMLEWESYWERSLRSGEVSSWTVGRKDGNLLMLDQFQATRAVLLGTGMGGMMADSLRLDVRDREEPRLDLDDRFLRSFMRLLIQFMCYSLKRQAAAFRLTTSSVFPLITCCLAQIYLDWRWLVVLRASFSYKSLISFCRYYSSSSLRILSAFWKASCCWLSCDQKSSVRRSMRLFMFFSVYSCFLFSFSNSRLMFSMATVFSTTSSFNFLNCFSMYRFASFLEVTAPLVLDRSSSLRLVRSLTSFSLSSYNCINFLLRVFTSPVVTISSRSQLAFRVAFSWSLTDSLECWVYRAARRCAIQVKRNSISLVWVVFKAAVSSWVSLEYFSLMASNSPSRLCSTSDNCLSRASIVFLYAPA